ncbi:hypothetical protein FRC20_001051 [Serendipita sp. 405]|nr:hypothetical protein FRC20_001051 [Serendipita sp. 405]
MSTDLVQTLPPALRNSIIEWAVALANITKCKYTSVAGLTVVMYDILLLSSDEVRLVWQRPWKNASRFAYLINRYVPPIFLIIANYQLGGFRGPLTHTFCKSWIPAASIVQVVTGTCATYILVLRVLALYRAGRAATIAIYVLFAISYGICLGITIDAVVVVKEQAFYDPRVHICNIKLTPRIFRFIFLTPIFFEILIGVLTFWKCFQHAYAIAHASAAPMIHIMLRDGLIWWTVVIGLRVWNALIWVFLPQSLIYLGIYIHWALVSTTVSRFFLNILDVGTHGPIDGFSAAYVTVREQERDAARRGLVTIGGGASDLVMEIAPHRRPRDEFDEFDEFFTPTDRCASALTRGYKARV